ncbi:MAG: type II toxin-antitoxin system VapC family toxin [Proteobacteria bacterium]|nr:type II toxin-antitoxin system VapC family toxin [Pseudomonadota bacterium]MCL2307714.1 type II toxin-antitoxin system VapC family toxin [Pseudomonadota bacterium]
MIGLDTNVLVRYIAQDDKKQSAQATKLMEAFTSEKPGFVSLIAIIELVWVLESCYESDKNEIINVIDTLLKTKELVVENAAVVQQALRIFSATNADFSDCLIERSGHHAGCRHTATFDRKASKMEGMIFVS